MTCICIGPVCIPIYSIIPVILLFLGKIWGSIKTLFGVKKEKEEDSGTCTGEKKSDCCNDGKSRSKTSKLRRRSKQFSGINHIGTAQELQQALEKANYVLVKFTASWCHPCKAIQPFFKELSEEFGNCMFVEVDVDEVDDLAEEYNVTAMPTFILLKDKSVVGSVMGARESGLKSLLEKNLD